MIVSLIYFPVALSFPKTEVEKTFYCSINLGTMILIITIASISRIGKPISKKERTGLRFQ